MKTVDDLKKYISSDLNVKTETRWLNQLRGLIFKHAITDDLNSMCRSDVSRLAGSVDAFEMDRKVFQKYSYFKFLQNISRKRTAEVSEFDECFQRPNL